MQHPWRLVAPLVMLLALGWGAAPASAAGLNLHRGSTGARVKTVETRLNQLHLLGRSQVDRRYRAPTVRAVRKFQRQMRLPVTGRVNRRTWDLVAREVRRRAAPKPPAAAPRPPAAEAPPAPAPLILGHRGARIPGLTENTLASLRYAADKADVLEFDLQVTADDELVLMHDDDLDRTTVCTGPVAQQTLEYLRTNCPTDNGGGPIPTFAEAAELAGSVGKAIAPEIKDPANQLKAETLARFVSVVQDHGLTARTYVQSFYPAVFARLRTLQPDLTFVYLTRTPVEPATVKSTGASIVGMNLAVITAAMVTRFASADVLLWGWTAATTTELRSLWDMGVAGVVTDIPDEARKLYHPS